MTTKLTLTITHDDDTNISDLSVKVDEILNEVLIDEMPDVEKVTVEKAT